MFYNVIKAAAVLPFVALLVAAPAAAESVSVRVSYAGLDLNSKAGVAEFDRRIAHAVMEVCAESDRTLVLNEYRRCTRSARASALTQKDTVIALARSANDRQQLASR